MTMTDYEIINDIDALADLADRWTSKDFSLDTEFTSLSYMKQKLIGMSMYDERQGIPPVFLQFNFDYTYRAKVSDPNGGRKKIDKYYKYTKSDSLDFEEARPYIQRIMDGASCICANAKVEWKILHKYGIKNWRIGDDVNNMSWLLNVETDSDLKSNARRELKAEMTSYTDTIGQKPDNVNWNLVDFEAYGKYGANDAFTTYKLRDIYRAKISALPALERCYDRLEIPLTYNVAKSEMKGVLIDVPFFSGLSKQLEKDIYKMEQEIFDEVGVEFNLGSPKQLAEILFDRLGYPVIKMSDKGGRSTDEDALKELAFQGYEVADDILDLRKLTKLKSTYVDAIPLMIDSDGRLRANLNQAGTKTGRFSSSKPNMQNQPNNKKYPIKRGFIPRPGYKFLVWDWSTIEIRIMAHESRDAKLIELLNAGRDIHQETTDSINKQFGLSLTRGDGKIINFAVLYLMGKRSLAYSLNKELKKLYKEGKYTKQEYMDRYVTEDTAQDIIDGFFNTYKGFKQWVKDVTNSVRQSGWVWTMGGRRRPVPELRNDKTFGFGKRRAVNTPIQGGAGDLMKLGINKLNEMLEARGFDADLLLYVHDEYLIEVREDQAEECNKAVEEVLVNIMPKCRVPIKAEGGIFDDWAGLKQGAATKTKKAQIPLPVLRKLGLL